MLESAAPGQEGFSSSALQLMFTLGTALGAGIGGAVVALADAGLLSLPAALAIVYGISALVALAGFGVGLRTPAGGEARGMEGMPATAAVLQGR